MIAFLISILSSGSLHAAGFATGNEFTSANIFGSITVYCSGNGEFDISDFNCEANTLDPVEFDYFKYDEAVDADQVVLKNRVNDKNVKQSRGYRKNKKRSSNRFNLWIWSLTQSPLLNPGDNTVKYELRKSGEVVKSGNFDVKVNIGEDRQCPRRVYNSMDINDCRSSFNICNRYFQDENYCQ